MKKFLCLILLSVFLASVFAAVTDYTFNEGIGTYTPLTTYTVSTAAGDNANQLLTLPFTFNYVETDYTSLYVVTNGFVRLGTVSTTSFSNTMSATASTRLEVLAPLWDDLYDDATSEIRYATIGDAPDRIFIIEWYDVLWNTSQGSRQQFQIWLYETSNIIRFCYNLQTPPVSSYASATIGINKVPGGNGNYLSVTPGNPSTISSTLSNNTIGSVAYLPSGKWYQFVPPDPNAPPAPAILVSPANDASTILEYAALKWSQTSSNTAGYKLYFGLTDPPDYIGDLGNVTTYNHNTLLTYNTTYYWKVVPYNGINLEAVNCPVWSFKIRENPVISNFPVTWNLGTDFSLPFPPLNCSRHSGVLQNPTTLGNDGTGSWGYFYWCNDNLSENVSAGMAYFGFENGWLIMPPVQIPTADYQVTFDLAYMSSYSNSTPPDTGGNDDIFAVLVGDGLTWTPANVVRQWDNQGSSYVLNDVSPTGMYVSLPLGAAGTKYVAFYGISTEWNVNNDIMIDNVTISQIPSDPIFSYTPAVLDFGEISINQQSDWQNVTVTNIGGGTLNLTAGDISIIGLDSSLFEFDSINLPAALPGSGTVQIPVRFNPLSEGLKEATLRISYGTTRTDYDVALSGIGSLGNEVTIGADNYNLNLPIYSDFAYSYSQTIYDQFLIDREGLITKISYYYDGSEEALASNDWVVFMAHSENNEFENDMEWMPLNNLTKVFEGEIALPDVAGWVEILLDTPFYYNNLEHLLIAVDENEPGNDASSCYFYSSPADANVSLLRYDPIVNPDPYAPIYANYLMDAFPNIKLLFESPVEDLIPPSIAHLPLLNTPRTDLPFVVTAEIVDDAYWNNLIDGANLYYSINGGIYIQTAMLMDREAWIATIPAQSLNTQISYYIEAWDMADNYAATEEYFFQVQEPVWITYNNTPTGFSNIPYSVWGAMNLFENPYYANGTPLQLLGVSGRMMDGALANLHIYTWDGTSDLTLGLVDIYNAEVIFDFDVYQNFDLSNLGIVINTPYFMVSFENLPENSYFSFDANRPYDVSYIKSYGEVSMYYKPGVWMIEAYVSQPVNLEAPELTISYIDGSVVLDWNEIDGALSYLVYSANEPYEEMENWFLEASTGLLSFTYTGSDPKKYFRVVATTDAVID